MRGAIFNKMLDFSSCYITTKRKSAEKLDKHECELYIWGFIL